MCQTFIQRGSVKTTENFLGTRVELVLRVRLSYPASGGSTAIGCRCCNWEERRDDQEDPERNRSPSSVPAGARRQSRGTDVRADGHHEPDRGRQTTHRRTH